MSVLDQISDVVVRGKRKEVGGLIEQALAEGYSPDVILSDGLMRGMAIVGDKFSRNEVFVPGMLVAARAMTTGTEALKPYLGSGDARTIGKAVIGTVKGDMHDIGKNLVRMMLSGRGIEVEDLGVDVDPEAFVAYLQQNPDCKIVCLSALLTTTMPAIGETIQAISEAGLRDGRIIMIGGAPVTQEYADSVGADAYTSDAGSCAAKAIELLTA